MSRIKLLSDLVANQIAAGEVVERPASVIKELVENSLDAGATKIDIEINGMGANRILIRDNGVGIHKEDLPLAFARHATSKIQTTQDLFGIQSLGFRGEALASIASVSRCTLKSKSKDAIDAWEIEVTPQGLSEIKPAARDVGTTIEVCDLFYNTPVRRKFLKSEKTESLAIEEMVKRLALANPQVNFSLKLDNKTIKTYPQRNENALTGLSKIMGQGFVDVGLPIDASISGMSLKGWVAHPQYARRTSDSQYFFVNGRIVKDKLVNHAIKSVFVQHPSWIDGTFPAYVLYLELDPKDVDVNVHPTKQEVRFTQSRLIYDFIESIVRKVIVHEPAFESHSASYSLGSKRFAQTTLSSVQQSETKVQTSQTAKERFFLFEENEQVYIVDLVKSKERLISAYLMHTESIVKKSLLFPQVVQMEKRIDLEWLSTMGFNCLFENNNVRIIQIPAIFAKALEQNVALEFLNWLHTRPNKKAICDWLGDKAQADFSILSSQALAGLIKSELGIHSEFVLQLSYEEMFEMYTQSRVI